MSADALLDRALFRPPIGSRWPGFAEEDPPRCSNAASPSWLRRGFWPDSGPHPTRSSPGSRASGLR